VVVVRVVVVVLGEVEAVGGWWEGGGDGCWWDGWWERGWGVGVSWDAVVGALWWFD